jgi:hypothetical protein
MMLTTTLTTCRNPLGKPADARRGTRMLYYKVEARRMICKQYWVQLELSMGMVVEDRPMLPS